MNGGCETICKSYCKEVQQVSTTLCKWGPKYNKNDNQVKIVSALHLKAQDGVELPLLSVTVEAKRRRRSKSGLGKLEFLFVCSCLG